MGIIKIKGKPDNDFLSYTNSTAVRYKNFLLSFPLPLRYDVKWGIGFLLPGSCDEDGDSDDILLGSETPME